MIAPDTNVLVRLLVVDGAAQSDRARTMFEQGDILILKTVLLETEGIGMEHEDACRAAVAAYAGGMGFADAPHTRSRHSEDGDVEILGVFHGALDIHKYALQDRILRHAGLKS